VKADRNLIFPWQDIAINGDIMSGCKLIGLNDGLKELHINSKDELLHSLNSIQNAGAKIIIMDMVDSGRMTIGIGPRVGFAEFMKDPDETPYLLTLNPEVSVENEKWNEFDSGGTPTPIPEKNCLPIATIIEIAVFFFENKSLPKNVVWVEE
jgi:hypothetical protein